MPQILFLERNLNVLFYWIEIVTKAEVSWQQLFKRLAGQHQKLIGKYMNNSNYRKIPYFWLNILMKLLLIGAEVN